MADVVELEGGGGDGYRAHVASDGAVDTMPAASPTAFTSFSASTSSQELTGAREGRRQIQIQDLDDTNAIHVSIDGSAATVNHLRIDPGQIYTFPPGVSTEAAIYVICPGGSAGVAVVEFYE